MSGCRGPGEGQWSDQPGTAGLERRAFPGRALRPEQQAEAVTSWSRRSHRMSHCVETRGRENAPGENAGPSHVSRRRALFSNSGGIRLLLSGVSLRDPGPGGLTVALRARPRLPAEGTLWKIHMRGTRAFDGRVSCGDVSPRARPAEGRCCERAQLRAASFAVTTGRARCRVNSGLLLLHP